MELLPADGIVTIIIVYMLQSISQSISQSINQSINQSIKERGLLSSKVAYVVLRQI